MSIAVIGLVLLAVVLVISFNAPRRSAARRGSYSAAPFVGTGDHGTHHHGGSDGGSGFDGGCGDGGGSSGGDGGGC
ncbi:hypothetical protein ACL03H_22530 [Saccharopolyspora sp. MS10]|uniref:hypothetical protein n=1 Tax=Saccharopolyspora sp. MS10 TaxID=3385973 RepID=UPI0039A3BBAC